MRPMNACASFLHNLFPFRRDNRRWAIVVVEVYGICWAVGAVLAFLLWLVEGEAWRVGDTLWFVFCSFHGLSFGDHYPRGTFGRAIAMCVSAMGYWFVILASCSVLLSQLTGEQDPTILTVPQRVAKASWPSFLVLCSLVVFLGVLILPFLECDEEVPFECNWFVGVYFIWCVLFKSPYGEIVPTNVASKLITSLAGLIGMLYMPYVLALVGLRRPTAEQYQALVSALQEQPLDASLLGRGYLAPDVKTDVRMSPVVPLPESQGLE